MRADKAPSEGGRDPYRPEDLGEGLMPRRLPQDMREPPRPIHLHSFRANPFSVRDALHAAQMRIERLLQVDDAWALELALAEIMNNIVEHGCSDTEQGMISLAMTLQDNELVCTIGDFGPELPSNCLRREKAPPEPDDLPESGFGWFLIRDLARDLQYEREAGCNWLILRFPLARPEDPV